MSKLDFSHMMYLTQQNLCNYEPTYEMWQNQHEVNLHMLASIALSEVAVLEGPIESINISINSIADLIAIVDKYPLSDKKYNVDIKMLHTIQTELRELNSMIGIASLKSAILDQLLYYLQGFHLQGCADDYKHTVLCGPPGSGKTEIAKIIGRMYSKMGVIKKPVGTGTATGSSVNFKKSAKKNKSN
jgi:hypothetical protein